MKKKILIVDDEVDFLTTMRERLEANDFEVIIASNGKEGLYKIQSEQPDAVLLDILMPEIDGLDTLKKIRKLNKYLPVFIITAHSDKRCFKEAKRLGASGFIVKSGDLKKEVENINKVLSVSDKYCHF